MFWVLLSFTALSADSATEIATAANDDLDEATRMAAFDRVVSNGLSSVNPVTTVAMNDGADARQRWVAVRALGKIKGPAAEDALRKLLKHDMPAMRAAAVQSMADIGTKSLSRDIVPMLEDEAIMVRIEAANALAEFRDPKSLDALNAALDDPTNYHRGASLFVRKTYVEAVGKIGDRKGLMILNKTLDDADPKVVEATIQALEKVAGFSLKEGRNTTQEKEAWRRWVKAEIRTNPPM